MTQHCECCGQEVLTVFPLAPAAGVTGVPDESVCFDCFDLVEQERHMQTIDTLLVVTLLSAPLLVA